jgi:LuxR family quorum sensing-dependent transcriptional regulator/LuxR family quorum-sensing system transcriptional regulator CciR
VRALLQVVAHSAVERALALRDGRSPSVSALSAREAQCLRHVAIGRPDAEIGQLLGISPRTVRFHVDSAKQKLGVQTRIQAVAKALRERIIAV